MKKEINTVGDVEEFFRYLRDERKVTFHPDDDFCCYVNRDTRTRQERSASTISQQPIQTTTGNNSSKTPIKRKGLNGFVR